MPPSSWFKRTSEAPQATDFQVDLLPADADVLQQMVGKRMQMLGVFPEIPCFRRVWNGVQSGRRGWSHHRRCADLCGYWRSRLAPCFPGQHPTWSRCADRLALVRPGTGYGHPHAARLDRDGFVQHRRRLACLAADRRSRPWMALVVLCRDCRVGSGGGWLHGV